MRHSTVPLVSAAHTLAYLQVLCPEEGVLVKAAEVLGHLLLDTLHTASEQEHAFHHLLVTGNELIVGGRAIDNAPAAQLVAGLEA